MDFGDAIRAAKAGSKISRSGWNGKGMFVVYQKAYPEGIPINQNTMPYLMFKTAQGDFVPWLASQTDVLAEDWSILG